MAAQLFPALGPWGVTTLRLCIAAIIMCAVIRPQVRAWRRDEWLAVVAFGVSMAGMNGFFYASVARVPLAIAVSVEFLGPLLLAVLLTRRVRDFAWVGLATVGMGLIGLESLTGDPLDPLGVILALISAFFWALYILCSARLGRMMPGRSGLAVGLVVASLALLPVGGAAGAAALTHPALLGMAVVTALFGSVIPYTLEFSALRMLPSRVFSILLSLEPVAAAALGFLVLGQVSGPLRLTAILLVIVASIGSTVSAGRPSTAS
jgi:inner membrane transporter RhtA